MNWIFRIVQCVMIVVLAGCESNAVHDVSAGAAVPAVVLARDTVQVERIDTREQPQVFIGQEHRYLVAPGERVFVVRYADIFYASNDTHDKVVSRPVRLAFVAEAGRQYAFTHAPLKTPEAARQFAREPTLRIVDTVSGADVVTRTEVGEDGGFFSSGQLPVDRDGFVAEAPGAGAASALPALQQAWREASEAQRREFLEWVRSYSP